MRHQTRPLAPGKNGWYVPGSQPSLAPVEDPYRDEQLVALYDTDNPGGRDHEYFRALADRIGARRIVDLGCGTGLLTRSLVAPDRTVIGVDPSPTMLNYARAQPGAADVQWLLGDATAIRPISQVDLAICTGNAIMHLSPEDLPLTMTALADVLSPGATFTFETRNPAFREWERWTPERTFSERETPLGQLKEWLQITEIEDDRVVFDAHNVLTTGEDRVYSSTLYFRSAEEFTTQLRTVGFDQIELAGDWDGVPLTEDSVIIVFRAVRS